MADIVVIGGGFGGTWFAKATGATLLTRSNGYDINDPVALHGAAGALSVLNPRVIANFASQSMVGQSWQSPEDWMRTNCVGQSALLHTMARLPRLERYIHFTTPEVYGSTSEWVRENWNFKPSTPYAVSRAAGDWMVKLWCEQYGFPAIFTRAANIYGEGQQLYRIIPKAFLAAMEGRKVPLHGGGMSVRSFIHMDDVTRALELLLEKGEVGKTYHIGPSDSITIAELVQRVGLQMGVDDLGEDAPDRPGKDEAYLLDSSKLRSLGWAPWVDLCQGFDRVEGWLRANRDTWSTWPREYEHRP